MASGKTSAAPMKRGVASSATAGQGLLPRIGRDADGAVAHPGAAQQALVAPEQPDGDPRQEHEPAHGEDEAPALEQDKAGRALLGPQQQDGDRQAEHHERGEGRAPEKRGEVRPRRTSARLGSPPVSAASEVGATEVG
jgi:hypothetical protein